MYWSFTFGSAGRHGQGLGNGGKQQPYDTHYYIADGRCSFSSAEVLPGCRRLLVPRRSSVPRITT